jgi:hypothetical protein
VAVAVAVPIFQATALYRATVGQELQALWQALHPELPVLVVAHTAQLVAVAVAAYWGVLAAQWVSEVVQVLTLLEPI